MARYHFDLESAHETFRDEQGAVARDLAHAVEQAILGLNEMRLSGELADAHDWSIVIRDETGAELRRVHL